MSSTYERILALKDSIYGELTSLQVDADLHAEEEFDACVRIQAFRRGIVCRRYTKFKHECAQRVQRTFRGSLARVKTKAIRKFRMEIESMAYFHYQAAAIQRVFRGFYSRRYTHDFYARKQFIQDVVKTSEKLRESLADHRRQLEEEARRKEEEDKRIEFSKITQNLHHLLSTQSQPGIYNSPFIQDDPPTVYNKKVEDHLNEQFKDYLRKEGGVVSISDRKKSIRDSRPISRRTLRSEGEYITAQDRTKKAERFERYKNVSSKNFTTYGKISHPIPQPIATGTEYIEFWRIAKSSRAFPSKNRKPFFTRVRNGKDFHEYDIERYERTRRLGGMRGNTR